MIGGFIPRPTKIVGGGPKRCHINLPEVYIRYLILLVFLLIPFNVIAENHLDENSTQTQIQAKQELSFKEEQDLLSKQLTAKAESLVGSRQGQCVVAIRDFLGVGKDEIKGAAKDTRINSQDPKVGSVIVFWGGGWNKWGHVGTVLFTTFDGYVVYYSPNARGTHKEIMAGKGRAIITKIKIGSKIIKGYRQVPISEI